MDVFDAGMHRRPRLEEEVIEDAGLYIQQPHLYYNDVQISLHTTIYTYYRVVERCRGSVT